MYFLYFRCNKSFKKKSFCIVTSVHCRELIHGTTNKMRRILLYMFIIQYHNEHSYVFRSARDHQQGLKNNAIPYKIVLATFVHS